MKRWPTKPLEEIAELYGGSTPSRDSPAFWGGDIYWVTPTDLPMPDEGISVVSKTKDRITQAGLDNSSATVVPKGTVLFSSRATIGKVAVADMPLTTNQGFANFVPHSEVTSRFLAYALWFHREDIARLSGSTTFKEVSRSTLRKYHLPVPPLAEQERIVKLLDEADELRKLRAQADRRTADFILALFHEMFGDPGTNSKGWPVKPFGDLASNQDGRRKPVKASDRAERKGEYPYYGASGIIDYVEEYLFDETALLIGEDGANLLARSTPIAFLAHGKYWVNNHAHVVTDNGKADLNYLCVALNLRDLTDYITGSAQPKLNQANMNRMPIPVPPLPLQKEFAARVAEIRAMEVQQLLSHQRLDALFQSLLHRAFRGEL